MGKKSGKKSKIEKVVENVEPDVIISQAKPENLENAVNLTENIEQRDETGQSILKSEGTEGGDTALNQGDTTGENIENIEKPRVSIGDDSKTKDDEAVQEIIIEKNAPKKKSGKKDKVKKVKDDSSAPEDGEKEEKPIKRKKEKDDSAPEDGEKKEKPIKGKKKKDESTPEDGEKKEKPIKRKKTNGDSTPEDVEKEKPIKGKKTKDDSVPEDGEKKDKPKQKKDKKKQKGKKPSEDESPSQIPRESTSISEIKPKPSGVSFPSETMLRKSATFAAENQIEQGKGKGKKGKKPVIKRLSNIISKDSVVSEEIEEGKTQQSRKFLPKNLKSASRVSYAVEPDESSTESEEDELNVEERGKKKKKEKGKKEKGGEKKEKKKEEKEKEKKPKEKKKKEKKEEKKKEEKVSDKQKDKQKTEETDEGLKKRLDEMKRMALEMGIDNALVDDILGVEKGPKKKMSKKEKARLTAEMAEKARQDMEAQAKRLEELMRKKQEEERLAAIEKDKKETMEQGLRMEQLEYCSALIQDVIDANVDKTRNEKKQIEWEKYVACGKLPNPTMCDQMNTYLHLWEQVLENTSIDDASKRTTDVIKLLDDLDEIIDTITSEDENKLENWTWIRTLFRLYQSSSLDVATYRLLRDVEHNLNRINIPTADFNFKDDYVTLCIWLRVMLPIPLPNPRRPPKPRIDISFNFMNASILFPLSIDCENAAIRAMYLKYDHLSDLSESFNMLELPTDYSMDLLTSSKKEWRAKLKYKYDKRDKPKIQKPVPQETTNEDQQDIVENAEQKPETQEKGTETDKGLPTEEQDDFGSDDEIPLVPFKQLDPTPSEHAITLEDQLYTATRTEVLRELPEEVINLRKYVVLGGVYHLNLLAQPPQPQDFITMEMTITGLYLPKKLELIPFFVEYNKPPNATESDPNVRRMPEEIEEDMKRQEEELDKLIAINIKWPQHVIFLELPVLCRWNEEKLQWTKQGIYDLKHNEEKCMLSFRTGVFGVFGLATYRYVNLPFQAYDIKPELDGSVTIQLTAAILMLEFNIKDGLICITQLQNSPNMTLQDVIGVYFKIHKLKRLMKGSGIDIFPAFDAFCYLEGSCEKQWAMEKHLYYNMAQMANSFNFSWSRWNLQAGRRKIVLQMRQYAVNKAKQKNHQMLLVTPLKASFVDCTEVSQVFSENDVELTKFCADLYHLMKTTSGIFVRNQVSKASKENVYTLAQFLKSTRILSFS